MGAEALTTRQCIEARADQLFHQLKNDENRARDLPVPSRATLLALALTDLVRQGSVVDRDRSTGPAVDVTLVIEAIKPTMTASSASTESTASTEAGVGFDPLNPYAPIDWMGNALREHCGPVRTADGGHVHPATAAVLLCDPAITALIVDPLGVPLDMGHEIRLANREQRRALKRRDGGCVFPGCDVPVGWCDAHHVTWWTRGGPTDISNLALLCRYHHGVTHRTGWTMTADDDHTFTWTTPSGDRLHSQRHRGRSPTRHLAHA
ncbi:MAG: HNH endonuclease signature motif containing protein [Acidimicrobiales bacterium]